MPFNRHSYFFVGGVPLLSTRTWCVTIIKATDKGSQRIWFIVGLEIQLFGECRPALLGNILLGNFHQRVGMWQSLFPEMLVPDQYRVRQSLRGTLTKIDSKSEYGSSDQSRPDDIDRLFQNIENNDCQKGSTKSSHVFSPVIIIPGYLCSTNWIQYRSDSIFRINSIAGRRKQLFHEWCASIRHISFYSSIERNCEKVGLPPSDPWRVHVTRLQAIVRN